MPNGIFKKILGGLSQAGKPGKAKKDKKSGSRVMIIEDDALLAKVLSEAFSVEGFEVIVVSNGSEAVAAVKKFKPHVILLDLIIPGLDGFAVLKEIKSDDDIKHIPVAIISNLSEAGDVKSTQVLGADEFFIKANTAMKEIIKYAKSKIKE